MNRAERRRIEREFQKADKIYTLNSEQIKDIKHKAVEEAVDTAFKLMLSIPVMVMHDKYSSLMRKEVNGKGREERFAEMVLELYDTYKQGYVSLEDLEKCLYEETGIRFDKGE